ncbi:hypothetical protein GCM10009569_30260 [Arthrobacter russicus]
MEGSQEIDHYVADVEEDMRPEASHAAPASRWREAWRSLRSQPVFIIAALLALLVLIAAFLPHLFTQESPTD